MCYGFLDIAITPSVKAVQAQMGSDHLWQDFEGQRAGNLFTGAEAAFVATRDSFYMASVSETGWPYVQHRGGPSGFLKMIDAQTLAFADFRGNRQFISTGNLSANSRICLFLMEYPRRRRLKIYAHAETLGLDDDPALTALVATPGYKAKLERVFRLRLAAFDWNCPQHITPRFTEAEISQAVAPMRAKLAELEAENAALRAKCEKWRDIVTDERPPLSPLTP
jgi:predicted pyridoxine 5'-phosphate oxidase superfamily flavin-nucleotide-binding protein